MYFWYSCGEEGDLHVLVLCHLEGTAQCMHSLNAAMIILKPGDLGFQPESLSPDILPYQDNSFGVLFSGSSQLTSL